MVSKEMERVFITSAQIKSRFQISGPTLWRWQRDLDLDFPKPMYINRLRYWRASDVDAWEVRQSQMTHKKHHLSKTP
jgi:predicted DNA-binding transcriptional regulator AlpA